MQDFQRPELHFNEALFWRESKTLSECNQLRDNSFGILAESPIVEMQ